MEDDMTIARSPRARWHEAMERHGHVELVTAWDCMTARLAEQTGFDAVVVGGGATANFMHGLPDVGLLSLAEVIENVRRISSSVSFPVITDVDDGGATPIHIRRTVEMAERAGAAGLMIEDTNATHPKHLWNEEKDDWDFSKAVLYPTDVAVDRVSIAMAARSDPQFVIMARTDALPTNAERGYDLAIERARAFASVGADMLFVLGLSRERVTTELTSSLGAPLLIGENQAITAEERERVFTTGASFLHGLLPLLAAFSGYKETIQSLKQGTPPAFDRDSSTVNKELLEAVDLLGWTRALAHPRRADGTAT
jgi:2-methylisocitrate lyase-like PEP mutase family enzyme